MSYYILQDDETNGPYTLGQLRAMWNSGALTAETMFSQDGYSEWFPLRTIIHELEPPPSVAPTAVPPAPAPPPLASHQTGSLRTCGDCAKTVSVHAEFCPHCGAVYKKKHGVFFYVFWGVLSLFGTLMILFLLPSLAVEGVQGFREGRNTAQKNACINNLRMIDNAKQQWALKNRRSDSDVPTQDEVKAYIKNKKFPTCPGGGDYQVLAVNTDPTCSRSADGHKLSSP